MESEAKSFSVRINNSISSLRIGHIKIWGLWLGRPYDNVYQLESAEFNGNTLIINSIYGSTFVFENPRGCTLYTGFVSVRDADSIKIQEGSYFHFYKKFGRIIFEKTTLGIFKYKLSKQKSLLAFEVYPPISF